MLLSSGSQGLTPEPLKALAGEQSRKESFWETKASGERRVSLSDEGSQCIALSVVSDATTNLKAPALHCSCPNR